MPPTPAARPSHTIHQNWILILAIALAIPPFAPAQALAQAKEILPAPSKTTDWKKFTTENSERIAYGIYLNGKKMGYTTEDFGLTRLNGEEFARLQSVSVLQVTFQGDTIDFHSETNFHYRLDPDSDGPMIFADETTIDEGRRSHSSATLREENGKAKIEAMLQIEGTKTRYITQPSTDTLAHHRDYKQWVKSQLQAGDEFRQSTLDFETISEADRNDPTLDPDLVETIRFVKTATARVGGVETDILELLISSEGIEFEARALTDGTMLNGLVGPFEFRLEKEADARQLDKVTLNSLAILPVKKQLGPPGKIQSLKLKISGLKFFDWPQSERQKIVSTNKERGEIILQLTAGYHDSLTEELSKEDRQKYTATTALIQADHPEILAMAEKLTKDKTTTMGKIAALNTWIYENLSFGFTENSSTALRVLRSRRGDCTEHALLLVALARSLGIPAREVGGYTYTEEDRAFWAHAWTQIYNGKRWIDVDPAWDEVGVNATHVLTTIIDKPMSELNMMGDIQLEVLSFKAAKSKSGLSRFLDLLKE